MASKWLFDRKQWPKAETSDVEGCQIVRRGVLRAFSFDGVCWRGQVLSDAGKWNAIPGVYGNPDAAIRSANECCAF